MSDALKEKGPTSIARTAALPGRGDEYGHAGGRVASFFATCHPGLEGAVAGELAALAGGGVHGVRAAKAGVHFRGGPDARYHANLHLRSAVRVLQLVAEGELDYAGGRRRPGDAVYDFVKRIDWPRFLERGMTFGVKAQVWDSEVTSSLLVQKRARDAVCDCLRDASGWRPEDPRGAPPSLPLNVAIFRDYAQVYLDTSGLSLHKRGYRRGAVHKAALNEAAAAGLLQLAGLDERAGRAEPLVLADPMCGSATLLIEAGLLLTRTAPGLLRDDWPFEAWTDFDAESWSAAVEQAEGERVALPADVVLTGNDVHEGALALAEEDAHAAGLGDAIAFECGECRDFAPPMRPSMVVTNPPWGLRLLGPGERDRRPGRGGSRSGEEGDTEDEAVRAPWTQLGGFLRRECPGADAFVLSGSKAATKFLRLSAAQKHVVSLGGVDAWLLHYAIRDRADIECFACGGTGHLARDCPEKERGGGGGGKGHGVAGLAFE